MADVAATLAAWSSTTNSNSPAGTATVGAGMDDNVREVQGVVVRGLSHKGSDIASATTTDLGAVEGLFHDITGTTTITGFGTVRAGIWKVIKFEGALTLTHNATSLILPGGINITTADGDEAVLHSEGSGNWRCASYFRAASGAYLNINGLTADATPARTTDYVATYDASAAAMKKVLLSNLGAQFFVGTFSRDVSTATGTQAVTGVGFTPRALIVFGTIASVGGIASWGMSDGSTDTAIYDNGTSSTDTYAQSANLALIQTAVGSFYEGVVDSFDADGFTIGWTKNGTPTGTAVFSYLAIR